MHTRSQSSEKIRMHWKWAKRTHLLNNKVRFVLLWLKQSFKLRKVPVPSFIIPRSNIQNSEVRMRIEKKIQIVWICVYTNATLIKENLLSKNFHIKYNAFTHHQANETMRTRIYQITINKPVNLYAMTMTTEAIFFLLREKNSLTVFGVDLPATTLTKYNHHTKCAC